jgi:3-hydroxyisobutyrate dehydrogenase-like beta-hydroxyacid dehydrogenase
LDIFVKDMGLVRKAAEERDFETPLSSAALELYLAGQAAGMGTEDDSGVIRMFRQRSAKGK